MTTDTMLDTASSLLSRRTLADSLALAIVAVATLNVVGWFVPAVSREFVEHPELAALPSRALLMVLVGLALSALSHASHTRARLLAVGIIGYAMTLVAFALLSLEHPLDRLLPLAGVRVAIAPHLIGAAQGTMGVAMALAITRLARRVVSERDLLVITSAGITIVGLSALRVLVYLSRADLGAPAPGYFSVAGLVVTIISCAALFLLVADRQSLPNLPPRFSPEFAGACALALTLAFWRVLDVRVAGTLPADGAAPSADGALLAQLPSLALVLGLCVSALLTLTLRLLRRNWEQARRLEHARLSAALETATDGVWEYDFVERRGVRSAAQLSHLGYHPERFNADRHAWSSIIHPDDIDRVMQDVARRSRQVADDGEIVYRVRAADQSYHTIVDRGRIVERTAEGLPRLIIGISADVTERLRADDARSASERRYRAVFESSLQGQVLLDGEGRCLEVNANALAIAGIEKHDVVGLPLRDTAWFTGLVTTQETITEQLALARAGESVRFDLDTHLLDGRLGRLECSMTPLPGASGTVQEVLCELRDVTARRRSEDALREIGALTTVGRLAARVAHEINNPLAGIRNSFLLLADAVPETHPHRRFLQSIDREIQRIAMVTRALYETYRADPDQNGESSLVLAVSDAATFLHQVNSGRQVQIDTDLAGAPPLVPVPDALLRQTLYNLLQNAVEASPIGGRVTLRARAEGDECVILVSDEGVSVPSHLRERIFEPLGGQRTTQLRTGSMGVGLALVRQSVEAVGGQVRLLDTEQGATFEVRLPMERIWLDAAAARRSTPARTATIA